MRLPGGATAGHEKRCIQPIDLRRFLTDRVEERHPPRSPAKVSMDKSLQQFRRSKANKIFFRKECSAA